MKLRCTTELAGRDNLGVDAKSNNAQEYHTEQWDDNAFSRPWHLSSERRQSSRCSQERYNGGDTSNRYRFDLSRRPVHVHHACDTFAIRLLAAHFVSFEAYLCAERVRHLSCNRQLQRAQIISLPDQQIVALRGQCI